MAVKQDSGDLEMFTPTMLKISRGLDDCVNRTLKRMGGNDRRLASIKALWAKLNQELAIYRVERCSCCPAARFVEISYPLKVSCYHHLRDMVLNFPGDGDCDCDEWGTFGTFDHNAGCLACKYSTYPLPPIRVECGVLDELVTESSQEPVSKKCPHLNKDEGCAYVEWVRFDTGLEGKMDAVVDYVIKINRNPCIADAEKKLGLTTAAERLGELILEADGKPIRKFFTIESVYEGFFFQEPGQFMAAKKNTNMVGEPQETIVLLDVEHRCCICSGHPDRLAVQEERWYNTGRILVGKGITKDRAGFGLQKSGEAMREIFRLIPDTVKVIINEVEPLLGI